MLLVRFLDAQTLFFFFWLEFFFFFLFGPASTSVLPKPGTSMLGLLKNTAGPAAAGRFFTWLFPSHPSETEKKGISFCLGSFLVQKADCSAGDYASPGPLIAERVFTFDTKIMDCWTTKLPMDYALYFEQMTKINNISFKHW